MLNVFKNIKFPVKKIRKPKFLNMGCICSKETKDEDKEVKEKKEKKNSSKKLEASVKKEEVVVEVDDGGNDAIIMEQKEKSVRKGGDKKKSFDNQPEQQQICRVLSVRNGVDPSQVVAGWPSWLTAVAGEAIKGWIPRSGESFEKLEKIGQGTYSSVYRARDLETGKIVALKKVRFMNMDPESVQFMAREILILRRLDHPNVMKLEGLVTSRVSGNFYLVFEYMEHDLAGLSTSPTVKLTESQIKCYMQQLFRGLEHCHNRGVLHRDIKGSNLLIDNNGNLKIGDFGLATFFRANQKQALTSRVVTLWYRPPELLLGATNYGVAVDMWSSGCILAELFAGKPIMPGRTEVEQLHKIFKLCGSPSDEYWTKSKLPHATIFKPQQPYKRTVAETFKNFPPSALSLLESLIAFEPELRGSATSALQSEFFTTKPLPCDPSSFPKFAPSKELDTKMREEEARKQRAAGGKGQESSKKGSKASKAAAAPDANADLQLSVQKRKGKSNLKSSSSEVGFQIEPSRGYNGHGMQKKNPLLHIVDQGSNLDSYVSYNSSGFREFKTQTSFKPQSTSAQLSRFSNSVASNNSSQLDFSRNNHSRWQEHTSNIDSGSTHANNVHLPQKDRGVYALKKTRMHYSGPLFPPSESVEDMLKEHEKRIQIAVRKARADKNKPKDEYAYRQTDSLLECQ